nr:outer membrane beta-barrel protein [Nitrobacter winogradskyi]
MTTTHLTPLLDVYAGVDTSVNTTFGNRFDRFNGGDNNAAAAFHGRIGLNLMDGALTVLATTHIGPENPNVSSVVLAGVNPNSALRYLNDVTVVWKATDKLTLTTDLNYIREEGFNAVGGRRHAIRHLCLQRLAQDHRTRRSLARQQWFFRCCIPRQPGLCQGRAW